MNTPDHISEDDLAMFALQTLRGDDAAVVAAHIQHCAVCRAQLSELQAAVALYAMSVELQEPPAHIRERLLSRVAAESRGVQAKSAAGEANDRTARERSSERVTAMPVRDSHRRSSLVLQLGWGVTALFALSAGLQYRQGKQLKNAVAYLKTQLAAAQESAYSTQQAVTTLTDPAALNVTLRQPAPDSSNSSAAPTAHAAYLQDRGTLLFVARNLKPLEPNKVYELWLLPANADTPPIPAGSFRPDARGGVTISLPVGTNLVPVKGFGLTREASGVSPAKPTLPILLAGTSKS